MTATWLALHLVGFTAWLGGLLAVLALRQAAGREDPAQGGVVARAAGSVYRILVGPGAMVTVVSGLILTLRLYGEATGDGLSGPLMVMQGLGLLAAMIALIVSVPTASRLARLEPVGPAAALCAELATRLRLADLITLGLGLAALVAGAMGR
ncbi:MAG: hypothetical protein M3N43_04030 [Actinomycetota bacterium]|nr:hypothetical protein [Actinomycetota bacterium]